MAGEYIQSWSDTSTSTRTSTTITISPSPTSDNLLILQLSFLLDPGTITPESGWTLLESGIGTATGYIYYKISDGTESSTVWSWVTARECAALVSEFSGLDASTPFDVSDENATYASTQQTAGAPINCGSITPTSQPGLSIAFAHGEDERDANDSELSIDLSFTKHAYAVAGAGRNPFVSIASKVYTALDAISPNWDTSLTGDWRLYAAIAGFIEPAGGLLIPIAADHYNHNTGSNL